MPCIHVLQAHHIHDYSTALMGMLCDLRLVAALQVATIAMDQVAQVEPTLSTTTRLAVRSCPCVFALSNSVQRHIGTSSPVLSCAESVTNNNYESSSGGGGEPFFVSLDALCLW